MEQAQTPLRLTLLLFMVLVVGTVLALSVAVHRDEGNPILYRGDGAIFRSNQYGRIIALFWEDGYYLNYGRIEEVRRSSDIGGQLLPCNADVTSCVALGGDGAVRLTLKGLWQSRLKPLTGMIFHEAEFD